MTRKARNSQVAEQAHLERARVEHLHGEDGDGQGGQLRPELAQRVAEEQLAEVVVTEQATAKLRGRFRLGGPRGGARGSRRFDGHASILTH